MQFNGHATEQDMVSLTNLWTKQNNTTFPLKQKVILANMGNRIILSEIHRAYGGWKYDDRNNTTFPIATTDLNANQTNYSLPLGTNQLNGVYVLTPNTTNSWTKLTPITLEEINRIEAEPNFENTAGSPRHYRALGNSIIIYPKSDTTIEDGLMIEYSEDVSTFATTDTTKQAGFDTMFHEAIPTFMSWQFAELNDLPNKVSLRNQWEDYVGSEEKRKIGRITRHYAKKFKDLYPPNMQGSNSSFNKINEYL
jgi:hypothetical protein